MPSLKSPVARTDLTLTSLAVQSLPFQKVQHKVTTRDAQPSAPGAASLIVNVTGLLVVSGTEHIIKPGHTLIIAPSSRSTTVRTHCSSPRCSTLSRRVGATMCTFNLIPSP